MVGLYEPKFPPVNDEVPVHVPVASGVPPKEENKLTDGPFEQTVIVPFVPAFGGVAQGPDIIIAPQTPE